jgi:hypothetical protein
MDIPVSIPIRPAFQARDICPVGASSCRLLPNNVFPNQCRGQTMPSGRKVAETLSSNADFIKQTDVRQR